MELHMTRKLVLASSVLVLSLFAFGCGPEHLTGTPSTLVAAESATCAGLDLAQCQADPQCEPEYWACDSICLPNHQCCPFRDCRAKADP